MLSDLLLTLGVFVLTLALRSFRHPFLRKLGAVGVLATSFIAGWRFTGYWMVGVFCAASWLLLPWLEILTRVRRLTLPLEKNLRQKTPPNSETFPALNEITEEIEGEKFEHISDSGWDWEDYAQFFRLFYKMAERTQSAICLIDQRDVAFFYLSVSSRAKDGTIWTTWNYPFSYSLKLVPQWRVNRLRGDQTFLQIYESHRHFLNENRVRLEDLEELDGDQIQNEIQKDLRAQINHNIATGVLTRNAAGEIRYSWRGMLFIWFQFLRDLVRLS
ncbi:hypothetical protein CfE428DRAFT_2970 [Chthoniobacter flavus Ellin428]|uniref:Uncharacterized protein n=1 Tax=Chthoniobacter flavus Ellin428 TaxID=497964 RepID=B4D245_9BACT|nr:hypothetical protein [Chthoniobacter flavus]EDY19285.1 hypothetical protein CfE428DRAFT_2970 [Chthoniobacter flavus Ellin428]TCO90582.1 hypothetical protein EV701_110206 [Chthoniobacter flavus]